MLCSISKFQSLRGAFALLLGFAALFFTPSRAQADAVFHASGYSDLWVDSSVIFFHHGGGWWVELTNGGEYAALYYEAYVDDVLVSGDSFTPFLADDFYDPNGYRIPRTSTIPDMTFISWQEPASSGWHHVYVTDRKSVV